MLSHIYVLKLEFFFLADMAHLPSQYERFEIGIDHSFQILNLNFYSRRMRWFVFVVRKYFC